MQTKVGFGDRCTDEPSVPWNESLPCPGRLPHLCYTPRGRASAPRCSCPSSSAMLGLTVGWQPGSPCRRQLPLTDDNSALQKQTLSQGSGCFPIFTTQFSTLQTFLKFSRNCFSGRLVLRAEGPHWEGSRENRPPGSAHLPTLGGWRGCVSLAGEPQTSHAHASSPEEQHHRQDPGDPACPSPCEWKPWVGARGLCCNRPSRALPGIRLGIHAPRGCLPAGSLLATDMCLNTLSEAKGELHCF